VEFVRSDGELYHKPVICSPSEDRACVLMYLMQDGDIHPRRSTTARRARRSASSFGRKLFILTGGRAEGGSTHGTSRAIVSPLFGGKRGRRVVDDQDAVDDAAPGVGSG